MIRTLRGRVTFAALAAVLALFVTPAPAWSHSSPGSAAQIGFDEKLGAYVPLDATFTGEDGRSVRLGDLVTAPTVLNFVYYRCKNECSTLLVGIATALRSVQAVPGTGYNVVTISINDKEGPKDALEKKAIALESIEKPFPPQSWRFLVGDDGNIDEIADAVGFSYTRKGEDFDHPLGLVILSPKGKVVRYLPGTDFLPVDLSMSLLEASSGIVRPTVAKLLRFCFVYDPASRQFGFNVLRVSGIVIGALIAGFALYLIISGRRRRIAQEG